MNENLINAAVVAAFLALIISLINAFRVSRVKKRCEVDILNQKEDMEVTWNNVKRGLGNDIKNIRREIKKQSGPANPQKGTKPAPKAQKPTPKKQDDKKADDIKSETGEQKPRTQRKPQANRSRNYKPRRKPAPKADSDNTSDKAE